MSTKRNDEMRAKLLLRPKLEEAEIGLKEDASNPDLWYGYAMALADQGRADDSVEAFSQGLVYNPFHALLYFGRGRRHIGPRRYQRAIADLTMAIRLDPEIYSFWYYRAVTNNLSGNYADAVSDFRQAITHTEPFERYGLIDWLFTTYTEMGDKASAKAVLDEIPDDIKPPQMHYGYKRRVQLYKGLITPENFIDLEDIKAHCVEQDNRVTLEVATLLFGLYVYYLYLGDEEKTNEALLKCLETPYPGAFGTIKAEDAARKRGLIS